MTKDWRSFLPSLRLLKPLHLMTQKQVELVKATWTLVATMDPVVVGGLFYNRLFEIAPQVKHMFRGEMPEQSKKLMAMIGFVINKLDKLDDIIAEVAKLGQRHGGYGVKPEHYTIVGSALIWTLEKGLGEVWTEQVKIAWVDCYTILSEAMINAAAEAEKAAA
jgi:hemoglobin-like flavoprotein